MAFLPDRQVPKFVLSKGSTTADERQGSAAVRFSETVLNQVLWQMGSGRVRRRLSIVLLGRSGGEPVAR